jgi:3-oxoacyl-ACP reductase-like protein
MEEVLALAAGSPLLEAGWLPPRRARRSGSLISAGIRRFVHAARAAFSRDWRSAERKREVEREVMMDHIVDSFRSGLFTGKQVLISGGSSGIGLAVAEGFARAGAAVIATGTSDEKLQAARADPAKSGIRFE